MRRVLDMVARRYGVDPARVLSWGPGRLRLAVECALDADADACRRICAITSGGGLVFPVVSLG